MIRTAMMTGLTLLVASFGGTHALEGPARLGRALAERMCAGCHAIDRNGTSPHVGAPPFRELDRRLDLDSFVSRLMDGLASGHPDMPTFRFSRQDAKALVFYLRAVEGP
jgi:mono/diheme cytochrome c family protein